MSANDQAALLAGELAASISNLKAVMGEDMRKVADKLNRDFVESNAAIIAMKAFDARQVERIHTAMKPLTEETTSSIRRLTEPIARLATQLEAVAKPSRQLTENMQKFIKPSRVMSEQVEQINDAMHQAAKVPLDQINPKLLEQMSISRSQAEAAIDQLSNAMRPSVDIATRLNEMLTLAKASQRALGEARGIRESLVSLRAQAVASAHAKGMSYADLSHALGVSKPLIQQMVQVGRRLDRIEETLEEVIGRLERVEAILSAVDPRKDQ